MKGGIKHVREVQKKVEINTKSSSGWRERRVKTETDRKEKVG